MTACRTLQFKVTNFALQSQPEARSFIEHQAFRSRDTGYPRFVTDNDATGSTPQAGDPGQKPEQEPDGAQPADDDPGYLTTTGETVGEDGSVVPIIGGLPAAEGSLWDIGAPADERGAGLAEELDDSADQDGS